MRPAVSQGKIGPLGNSSFTSQFALFGIQIEPGVTGFHPNSQTDSLCCYSPCFRKSLCWCREVRPCFHLSAAPLGSGTISLVSLLCACFQGVCFPPSFYQNCECRWYPSSCKHCSHFSSSSAPHAPMPGFTWQVWKCQTVLPLNLKGVMLPSFNSWEQGRSNTFHKRIPNPPILTRSSRCAKKLASGRQYTITFWRDDSDNIHNPK